MRVLTCAADVAALREGLRDLAVASEGKTLTTLAAVGPLPGADREPPNLRTPLPECPGYFWPPAAPAGLGRRVAIS